jgi:hypothetical protein
LSLIIPQTAVSLTQALRAIANRAERGEIRSFYVVVVDAKGAVQNAAYLSPANYDADVQHLGNAVCDMAEKLAASATQLRGKVHGLRQ